MNSVVVLALGVTLAILGYYLYGRWADRSVIGADPRKTTPARMFMDGVDFTPASRNVLFGYQFKSIAALGPLIGPITALQWGWLPTLVWLFLGVLFIGWVHDYASTVVGVRNEGQTFGALSYRLISPRARIILLVFIYLYLLLIMGGFGAIVAGAISNPKVPLGLIVLTLAGVLAGQMIYRWRQDIILTTLVTFAISMAGIWLSTLPAVADMFTAINGGAKPPVVFGAVTQPMLIWSLFAMAFCYLGAVLPIWRFAQPVNYVSFWIVLVGMLGAIVSIIVWHPSFEDVPAFTGFTIGIGPLWPILFVTVACGAISGWHGLVSSSGTARQLEKETDALPVAGGSMLAEMVLATIALIIAAAGFASFAGYKEALGKGAAAVFSQGLGTFLSKIGIPTDFGVAFGAVFLAIMALTVMQLVLRFMRVAGAEFVGDALPAMKNAHVGAIVAIVLSLILVWTGFWQTIWVLFGGANQLMASLALLLISTWLIREGKGYTWTWYPAIFMYVTTVAALLYTAFDAFNKVLTGAIRPEQVPGSVVAGAIALVLVGAALVLAYDGVQAMNRLKAEALRKRTA